MMRRTDQVNLASQTLFLDPLRLLASFTQTRFVFVDKVPSNHCGMLFPSPISPIAT